MKNFSLVLLLVVSFLTEGVAQRKKNVTQAATVGTVWSAEKANEWYKKQPWIVGANFIPSTAINQLEMWQADTFDSATINRELGWAAATGFNAMRVFLHSIAWHQDPAGFRDRVNTYLGIADRHGIKTIFVFFDDVWNKEPKAGAQPAQKPGVHNSGWMQDPGQLASSDTSRFPALEKYVKDILNAYKNDDRVLFWDLYNEPGNTDKGSATLPLLRQIFSWARAVNPSQPISVGLWKWELDTLNAFQFTNSDIVTYHSYEEPTAHLRMVQLLKASGRPVICTEYMARTRNSRFANTLPMLKKENIGAIHWGLVEGKTNTIYEWNNPIPDGSQPVEWFHDVFFRDGTPYRNDEINLIKKLTGKSE